MRILLFIVVLTILGVAGIEHVTGKKSPLEDKDWIPRQNLIRFEVGSSCPLYYPKEEF